MASKGCGSWSCKNKRPEGQGVNGPCRCEDIFMEFQEYQKFVKEVSTTRVDGDIGRINWAIQELVAEAGEVLGVSAKGWRKGTPIDKDRLWDELGDTFWGVAAVMNEAFPERTLDDLMIYNKNKLEARIAATKAG